MSDKSDGDKTKEEVPGEATEAPAAVDGHAEVTEVDGAVAADPLKAAEVDEMTEFRGKDSIRLRADAIQKTLEMAAIKVKKSPDVESAFSGPSSFLNFRLQKSFYCGRHYCVSLSHLFPLTSHLHTQAALGPRLLCALDIPSV